MKVERKEQWFCDIRVGEMFEYLGEPYLKTDKKEAFNFTTNDINEFDEEKVFALNAKVVIE